MARRNRPEKPDGAVIAAEVEKTRLRYEAIKAGVIGATIVLSVLAVWPIATVLAGKTTVLNVAVTVTLTIALTLTTAGFMQRARHHRQRADRAESRERILEARVMTKIEELRVAALRIEALEHDIDGIRSDLRGLRGSS
jgi:C4-dicarboxylate-specific signal transduction histidine kinase